MTDDPYSSAVNCCWLRSYANLFIEGYLDGVYIFVLARDVDDEEVVEGKPFVMEKVKGEIEDLT